MPTAFIQKLQCWAELTNEDQRVLRRVVGEVRMVGPHQDLIHEGYRPNHVHLLLEGFACRYKLLPRGERKIMAYLVPGDLCDLPVAILGALDHSIATLSPCQIVNIPHRTIQNLMHNHPRINEALFRLSLVDDIIMRHWLCTSSDRPADRHLAHLLCELLMRLQAVGIATENSYEFPIIPAEFGGTFGISPVDVEQILQRLQAEGLISFRGSHLTITDVQDLKEFADFNPNYLHLNHNGGNRNETSNGKYLPIPE